ncbi:hypothetical protein TNCT1_01470 [Streptomyces sp. 1-11]|nr:hypothetical protein TNCT1_01470 [Streptomyces sp. 1-11]
MRESMCGIAEPDPAPPVGVRVLGLPLITRVRLRGCSWILVFRFGPYVNSGRKSVPEE